LERYLNGRGGAARAGPRPKATVREGSRYLRAELAGIRRSGSGAVGGPRAGRLELNGVEASRAAVPDRCPGPRRVSPSPLLGVEAGLFGTRDLSPAKRGFATENPN